MGTYFCTCRRGLHENVCYACAKCLTTLRTGVSSNLLRTLPQSDGLEEVLLLGTSRESGDQPIDSISAEASPCRLISTRIFSSSVGRLQTTAVCTSEKGRLLPSAFLSLLSPDDPRAFRWPLPCGWRVGWIASSLPYGIDARKRQRVAVICTCTRAEVWLYFGLNPPHLRHLRSRMYTYTFIERGVLACWLPRCRHAGVPACRPKGWLTHLFSDQHPAAAERGTLQYQIPLI